MTLKVLTVFGTRPEAIKMAPVVLAMEKDKDIESRVCVTGQHRQMLDQVLELFDIKPDYDLNIMKPGQDLYDVTSNTLLGMREVLQECKPDLVLVHGDTTTCFAAGLAAFYQQFKIGHVEAGLRTGDMYAPFPEEANRSLIGRIADFHFSPTETSKNNLLNENVSEQKITVTGNTVIDALFIVRNMVENYPAEHWIALLGDDLFKRVKDAGRKLVLITGHRRENFGQGFIDLCEAIKHLSIEHPDWDLIYPVHLNPNVQKPVYDILNGLENVHLIEPLDYAPFVWLMNESDIVLTDSGGIQEEAPSLGKPVLVMRNVTERPEAVMAGTVQLVGTNKAQIIKGVEDILLNQETYRLMSEKHNPYGDGFAVERIIRFIKDQNI
mgnify:CR=1 FL=1|jgi:UDP-N-acetylglucosamine 2-epimerase (non-hydrolysing)